MSQTIISCTLCKSEGPHKLVFTQDGRQSWKCCNCWLIFVEPDTHLPFDAEKKRYQLHENNPEDENYVKFLQQLTSPALKYLEKGMLGLDYGCGPSPTIQYILKPYGICCNNYDPFFFPELKQLEYDFILATECFEHFHFPAKEINTIKEILKPGGVLGIMTSFWDNNLPFEKWYYSRDPTHVCFYHSNTFKFIAEEFGFSLLETDGKRVILLQRP